MKYFLSYMGWAFSNKVIYILLRGSGVVSCIPVQNKSNLGDSESCKCFKNKRGVFGTKRACSSKFV